MQISFCREREKSNYLARALKVCVSVCVRLKERERIESASNLHSLKHNKKRDSSEREKNKFATAPAAAPANSNYLVYLRSNLF